MIRDITELSNEMIKFDEYISLPDDQRRMVLMRMIHIIKIELCVLV